MPSTEFSPFADPRTATSYIVSGGGQAAGIIEEPNDEKFMVQQRMNTNIDNSLMVASTDFPSEIVTSRAIPLPTQS